MVQGFASIVSKVIKQQRLESWPPSRSRGITNFRQLALSQYLVQPILDDYWDYDSPSSSIGDISAISAIDVGNRKLKRRTTLEEDMIVAMVEAPEGSNTRFLPADEIKRLITIPSILGELKRSVPDQHDLMQPQSVELIHRRFSRVFGLLVLCHAVNFLKEFILEGLDDNELPFRRLEAEFFRKCKPEHQIESTRQWSTDMIYQFSRYQWSFLSPVFDHGALGKHYVFERNTILPFTQGSFDADARIHAGGSAQVIEAKIHQAHGFLNPRAESPSEDFNASFAIKRVSCAKKREFDQEIRMYKSLKGLPEHAHLATLLWTYEHRWHYHLVFPWADCNLRELWEKKPVPTLSLSNMEWFLNQLKGLASATMNIHGYRSTMEALQKSRTNDLPATHGSPNSKGSGTFYRRHGDIKPENILYFEGLSGGILGKLILSDFGLMKSYTKRTGLRSLSFRAGTLAYASPELTASRNPNSRADDIWSLGCVYLEFTIWLFCGLDGLRKFNVSRGPTFYMQDPTIGALDSQGHKLSGRVEYTLRQLHKEPRCSQFMHDFLDLIFDMLLIPAANRVCIGEVNARLSEMVATGKRGSGYLTKPCPRFGPFHSQMKSELQQSRKLSDSGLPSRCSDTATSKHFKFSMHRSNTWAYSQ